MSADAKLDILIVTTSFAPENAIGAVRISKVAKYLVKQGHRVTVVSPTLDQDVPRDLSLECDEFSSLRRVTVEQSAWFQRTFANRRKQILKKGSAASFITSTGADSVVKKLKVLAGRYVHFSYTMIRNWDWSRQVLRDPALKAGPYDLVLSSYPSLGAMWAAGAAHKRGDARRWIADFRDPVNYANPSAVLYRCNEAIQRAILRNADRVVAVSHGVLKKFDSRYLDKCAVLPNGYDPADRPSMKGHRHGACLTLCYVGSLHGGARDLGPLFAAIAALVAEGAMSKESVRLEYAGKDFAILRAQAAGHGVDAILVDKGLVTRDSSLRIQMEADLVVVSTWNTAQDQGVMTGKLFECFLMRKPVVGIVGGDLPRSEFRQVVEAVGAGIAVEAGSDDPAGEMARLRAFLVDAYRAKRVNGRVSDGYNEQVERYSYPHITKSLTSIAVELQEGR